MYKNIKIGFINLFLLYICLFSYNVYCEENIEDISIDSENVPEEETIEIVYVTPRTPPNAYVFETFDDISLFEKNWVKSSAKKDDVDEDIAKYDGVWSVETLEKDALIGDKGLVLKSKAKHAAISVGLKKPFVFKDKPFVVQYEINLQNGQECGGAYLKLISHSKKEVDLNKVNDKTPYTIMFGPDKCGNEHKLHFIFRHVNPVTKEIEEKHCKRPKDKLEAIFKDKRTHLYTLVLRPDNTFQILLDHEVINSGHLLEDFTPSVNPPKEINDPNDTKPSDWDEREQISNPNAAKPDDWDEDAPRQIVDQFAEKPEGWLEEEPDLIPDPEAIKPEDWDDDMDGEWEAPLVPNPKCGEAPGCGKWTAPTIDNPSYKGKWKAPMIDNPNYKGKWAPRKIQNPDFFEDLEPFKMTSIGAISLELWSMSDGMYFDNFLITDNVDEAYQVALETHGLKIAKLEKGQKGYFTQFIEFSNQRPWIYGIYVLVLAIPVVLVFVCCCAEDASEDKTAAAAAALRKKTDEPTEDDPAPDAEEKRKSDAEDKNDEAEEDENEQGGNDDDEEEEEEGEEEEEPEKISKKSESEGEKSENDDTRKSPRLRKTRKE